VIILIGAWASSRISHCVFSASLIDEIPSWITLECYSISLLMLVLTWARSKWNPLLTSKSEFLRPRVVTKFVRVIISSRTTTRVNMCLNSTYRVFEVPSRVSLLHCPISLIMIILTRSWTKRNFFLAPHSEFLRPRVVTKFVFIIVSTRTSGRIGNGILSASIISPVPRWIALSHNTICLLMSVLAWARSVWDNKLSSNSKVVSS
jgi:hypothetical protein